MRVISLLGLSVLLAVTAMAQVDDPLPYPLPYVDKKIPWDTAPRFPGGAEALRQYFQDSIRHPAEGWPSGRSGSVLATIQVDAKGRITDVRIVNGVPGAPGMARETERLLLAMPRWRPATKGRRRVPGEVHLSVPFN